MKNLKSEEMIDEMQIRFEVINVILKGLEKN